MDEMEYSDYGSDYGSDAGSDDGPDDAEIGRRLKDLHKETFSFAGLNEDYVKCVRAIAQKYGAISAELIHHSLQVLVASCMFKSSLSHRDVKAWNRLITVMVGNPCSGKQRAIKFVDELSRELHQISGRQFPVLNGCVLFDIGSLMEKMNECELSPGRLFMAQYGGIILLRRMMKPESHDDSEDEDDEDDDSQDKKCKCGKCPPGRKIAMMRAICRGEDALDACDYGRGCAPVCVVQPTLCAIAKVSFAEAVGCSDLLAASHAEGNGVSVFCPKPTYRSCRLPEWRAPGMPGGPAIPRSTDPTPEDILKTLIAAIYRSYRDLHCELLVDANLKFFFGESKLRQHLDGRLGGELTTSMLKNVASYLESDKQRSLRLKRVHPRVNIRHALGEAAAAKLEHSCQDHRGASSALKYTLPVHAINRYMPYVMQTLQTTTTAANNDGAAAAPTPADPAKKAKRVAPAKKLVRARAYFDPPACLRPSCIVKESDVHAGLIAAAYFEKQMTILTGQG
jgi:hypothetical protein